MSVWGFRGRAWAPDSLPDMLPTFRGFPASRERAAESSFPASDWKAGPCSACALGSRAPRAPRPHHPGAGGALRTPAPPPSHVCAAGAHGPGGAQPLAARWASADPGRDPGGHPERSLGPAGRRRRAGCGGEDNLFRGNEHGDCWPWIHFTGLPSLPDDLLVAGPSRTVCSFIATVKAGSCQHSARAHTHTRGKTFFKK